jgi:hypothetical protein
MSWTPPAAEKEMILFSAVGRGERRWHWNAMQQEILEVIPNSWIWQ